ncbi:hypothetical protein [Bacteroides uniformis]|uniref:hypothetical protein n=1 Tax=Bacteroides uniformis TaxID=820 RepID=UPI002165B78D|nr:hypothetical protein [Bacteroides uniformis]MCS2415201.1 hypothetical protein [Bacteroides uniformis]
MKSSSVSWPTTTPLTERTDDFYLRAKTQPRTLDITEIARETARQLGKYGENPLG